MSERSFSGVDQDVVERENPFQTRLRSLLREVADGATSIQEAAEALRDLPFADLGFARVDHHRELRQGHCEIVFAPGKSSAQVGAIVERVLDGNQGPVLVTRATAEQSATVRQIAAARGFEVDERPGPGMVAILRNVPRPAGRVLVVTAGTSDLPV